MCNLQKSMWVSDGFVIFFLFSFSVLAAVKLLQQHTRYCWLCIKKQRPIPKTTTSIQQLGIRFSGVLNANRPGFQSGDTQAVNGLWERSSSP